MAKANFGNVTGTCTICGINCWDASESKPAIFPCGVKSCPYETLEQQLIAEKQLIEFSESGSSILQLMQET